MRETRGLLLVLSLFGSQCPLLGVRLHCIQVKGFWNLKKKKINSPPIWCSLNSGLPQSICYHLLSRVFKQVLNAFCPHCIIKRYRVYILPETLVCYFALQIFYCTCHDCLLGGSIWTCGCTINFC